jgi:hypothetical protein
MAATVLVLFTGVISFAINGDFYAKHANRLMVARVVFQGVALALFALLVLLAVI